MATDTLRASRDGDQFHYYWAARQCLGLLAPGSLLAAVSIEGVSPQEFPDAQVDDGEQVIDIAEYYGSEQVYDTDLVVYRQLKHSTVRTTEPITMSGLERSLTEFAKRFRSLRARDVDVSTKVRFQLISNRPVGEKVLQTLEDLSGGRPGRHGAEMKMLRRYLGGDADTDVAEVARALDLRGHELGLKALRSDFESGVADFLPGMRGDAALRLKEIVTQRASSLGDECAIRRADVLAAPGATEDQLLQAPPRLPLVPKLIDRPRFREAAKKIITAGCPVIVHAVGGVGKSVLAGALEQYLPEGSACVTYDCFGAGGYRRMSEPRHEHRQALLQISNELAGRRLCQPLVPTPNATASDYAHAFLDRVNKSAAALAAMTPGALLVIAVDAADNAVMAESEFNSRSFVPDLLAQSQWPVNARLVMFARTERIAALEPPPSAMRVELTGFSLAETAAYMRAEFADAAEADVAEFHTLTFGNPRVQAQVLDEADSVGECLRLLAAFSAGDAAGALDSVIDNAVQRIRRHRAIKVEEVDLICEALAALRPRVPVRVIAELCSLPVNLIRSFVSDIGRPLHFDGECVQFRDEPTETWFRKNHKPSGQALAAFLSRLRPLADRYAYVAASLPQLLWEAQQFAELVQLAVDGAALPTENELERAEIEQQRIQFALKSAMKRNMKPEVARLALKAGSLSVGHSRRLKLIKDNTHLAGELLDGQTLDDLVARRAFSDEWPGSNLGYEGCMLSFASGQRDVARSRLRSAIDWMVGWSRLPDEAKKDRHFGDDGIAQVALGLVNTDGPHDAAAYLERWKPPTAAYRAGLIVAERLIETGRVEDLNALIVAAAGNKFIQMGVLHQVGRFDITLGRDAAVTVLKTLRRRRKPIDVFEGRYEYGRENHLLYAAIAAVTAGAVHGLAEQEVLLRILGTYLPAPPPRGLGDRFAKDSDVVLKGFALKAYFERREFTERDLAHPELLEELDKPHHDDSRELRDFRSNVIPVVPWAAIWARTACAYQEGEVPTGLEQLADTTYGRDVSDYRTPWTMLRVVARLSAQIISRCHSPSLTQNYRDWLQRTQRHHSWLTLVDVVRYCAHATHMDETAFAVAAWLDESISHARTQASEKVSTFAELARAICPASLEESRAFFGRAIHTADKIGDDVMQRWEAINALAQHASKAGEDGQRAYLTARTFEALAEYLDGEVDHEECIRTVSKFSMPCALALAARWRARRFGSANRVLQALLDVDTGLATHIPLAAVALLPLAETFDVHTVLEQALSSEQAVPGLLFEVVSYYDRTERHAIEYFERIEALASRYSVELSDTSYAPHRYQRRLYDADKHSSHYSNTRSLGGKSDYETRRTADLAALKALDLSDPVDLETARRMCRARASSLRADDLVTALLATPARHLHKAIDNVRTNSHSDVYTYQSVLERVTGTTGLPRAALDATRDLAMHAVSRFCDRLAAAPRYHERLSVELLARATGKPPDVLYDLALAELGTRSDFLDAQECFGLVYRITPWLSAEHARDALDQAIAELDYLNDADTADGPWTTQLVPPTDLHRCAAGYIWSALADPDEAVRWRAAHTVHMLCRLRATAELQALAELATTVSAGPFSDARLTFYNKHALMWLFLAIERASVDAATQLRPFETVLRQAAFGTDTNVLLRESARRVLTTLHRDGLTSLSPSERDRLARLNQPVGRLQGHARRPSWGQRTHSCDEGGLWFSMDFEEHWIEPLARCFDMPLEYVARQVSEVITRSWQVRVTGGHVEDQRLTRNILEHERTSYYKSEMPAVHDLDFYLSFHALMTVAGRLIDTTSVHIDPRSVYDDFPDWLQGFRPTRLDGRWLADRRDPVPTDQLTLLDPAYRDGAWLEEVTREDFLSRIFDTDLGMITVWEWSEQQYAGATETVTVTSALVEPSRAAHLLAAWQTAESWRHFKVPRAGGDDDLDVDGYRLAGWIEEGAMISGLDGPDPLAGSVQFPGPRPSPQACQWLNISGDPDQRAWSRGGEDVMNSSVWSDMQRGRGQSSGSQGERLTISLDDLRRLTEVTAMSVIFKVVIERRKRKPGSDWTELDDQEERNVDRCFKVLIFDRRLGFTEL